MTQLRPGYQQYSSSQPVLKPEPEPEPEPEPKTGRLLSWISGEIEKPLGAKNMGTWTASVYTEEQQQRLGVNEKGYLIIKEDDNQENDNQEDDNQQDENQEDDNQEDENQEDENQEDDNQEDDNQEDENQEDENQEDDNQEDENQEDDNQESESPTSERLNYRPRMRPIEMSRPVVSRMARPEEIYNKYAERPLSMERPEEIYTPATRMRPLNYPNDTDSESSYPSSNVTNVRPSGPPPPPPDLEEGLDIGKSVDWNDENINSMENILLKLKYNRIISYFFFYELKKKEQYWSWLIILISTFTSGLTVINTIDEEKIPIKNFETINNISLTVFSMITSLIAAWIKKERYVERLNELDRYSQKINKICEEIDFELLKSPDDKNNYKEFKDKQFPLISEYLGSNPSISPKEWKHSVYKITTKYPELITWSGSKDEYLWPWYKEIDPNKTDREESDFSDTIRRSYKKKKRFWFF